MENQNEILSPTLDFDYQRDTENHSIIKVVGVGGGGGNAVQHMYDAGIADVSFLVINTDKQALKASSIPNKLLISDKGLGAGAKPDVARDYAIQYTEAIRNALSDGTEMVFITAGMGGGTGTGAAPIVAQIAQEMGILTVGIVTIPFRFEGRKKINMALEGVRAIEKYCDAMIVVNNNRLIEVYPDLNFGNAFAKADDTLTTAAKSISDIININGYVNLDFADVSTTLRNGGVALISTGSASGDNRLSNAIEAAITSPLLQDNNITDARHLMFELCFSHQNPLTMAEMEKMNDFVDGLNNSDIEVIWGAMYDDSLGDNVRIILLASGFSMNHNTGSVVASDRINQVLRELKQQLCIAIDAKKELLYEFDNCPEASEILMSAIRKATDKANNLSADDDLDEEVAKLDIALSQAREKVQEVINEQKKKEAEEALRRQREELEAQLAAIQAKLNSGLVSEVPASQPESQTNAVVAKSNDAQATESASTEASATIPTETAPAAVQEVVTETPASPQNAPAGPAPTPHTASSALDGIEQIRQFYGEEAVSKFMLSDARKAYYVLDDEELTNEELIRRLEQVPAYNRSLEDLGQLKAVSRQPAQPRVVSKNNDGPDGTIKF